MNIFAFKTIASNRELENLTGNKHDEVIKVAIDLHRVASWYEQEETYENEEVKGVCVSLYSGDSYFIPIPFDDFTDIVKGDNVKIKYKAK